jgi:hypothetical protein
MDAVMTPQQADLEFAETLEALADEVGLAGDEEFAAYFRDAAAWHRNPLDPRKPHAFDRAGDPPGGFCRCGWAEGARVHMFHARNGG